MHQDEEPLPRHHDDIAMWILANVGSYVQGRYDPTVQLAKVSMPDLIIGQPPEVKIKTTLEYLVTGKNETFIGFIDVLAEINYAYLDLEYTPKWTERIDAFCFEAKPCIPSLGELMRQIRKYQKYFTQNQFHSVTFVVVSPDTHYRNVIRSQGIEFWECPPLLQLPDTGTLFE